MSAQTIHDAFQTVHQAHRERIYSETWGHLAPRRNKRYKGEILFAHGEYGDLVPLRCELKDLPDSPWFFEAMQDFIEESATEEGVYRFIGYFCNYRFVGTVERLDL